MPAEKLSMRKVRELLRLKASGLGNREIGQILHLSPGTVCRYSQRAAHVGVSWPLPETITDTELEAALFPSVCSRVLTVPLTAVPDWAVVHQELKRKGVTLLLLWQEHQERSAGATTYSYSHFCALYQKHQGSIQYWMRQDHKAGERLFVDYAGQTLPIVDATTGEVYPVAIFIAVLGASQYTYVEATQDQQLPHWIASHRRAFEFFGGVPELVVPDNLLSGVTKAHRYEPLLNRTYEDMARHYGTAILPARVRKPKDKAKVEGAVLIVSRWILAALRNHTFFSVAELNAEIRVLLERYNQKPFKKLPGCRRSQFESLDQPVLKPLPTTPYVYAEWKIVRVGFDYHVDIEKHFYSVHYKFLKKMLDARITHTTVELFYKGERVALHARSPRAHGHTTLSAHMPKSHQAYLEWTPARIQQWANKIGANTGQFIEKMMNVCAHPQQAYRRCLGVLRLAKVYDETRLEHATARALAIGAIRYRSVESILKNELDKVPLNLPQDPQSVMRLVQEHANIRGPGQFV